jgi:hypothetical protein
MDRNIMIPHSRHMLERQMDLHLSTVLTLEHYV